MEILFGYLFVGVVFGVVAGRVAEWRGRDFWVYFVFTIVFPFTALISVPYLVLFARRAPDDEGEEAFAAEPEDDRLGSLERLVRLRDAGALSDAEFESEKTRLLGRE